MKNQTKFVAAFFTFILHSCFSIILHAQSSIKRQDLVCSYQLKYQRDSTEKTIRSEYFTLLVSQNSSLFQNPRSRSRDSLRSVMMSYIKQPEIMSSYMKKVMELSMENDKFIIYKDKTAKNLFYYDWIGSKLYLYREPLATFKWNILPKTKIISGYNCQQAVTVFGGRIFEAWFTREIPVSDGPYKFCGLPGLIISVSDTRQHYTFELLSLKASSTALNLSLPIYPAIATSKLELRQGQTAYQASLAGPAPTLGNIPSTPTTAARREAVLKFNRRRNNPIELK
jgi:GLPGLI family protein